MAARWNISSFTLKVIAIIGMTACHIGYVFADRLPSEIAGLLQACGGVTFPIMAFLLVEGYKHTSNVGKYALRLLGFAFLSQVPYWLTLGWEGNVLFTLLLSLFILVLYDTARRERFGWGVFTALLAAILIVSLVCDWGFLGPIMIFMMYVEKKPVRRIVAPLAVAVIGLGVPAGMELLAVATAKTLEGAGISLWVALPGFLYAAVGIPIAGFLLSRYGGRRGKPCKWFFYLYYPAHMAAIGAIEALLSFARVLS